MSDTAPPPLFEDPHGPEHRRPVPARAARLANRAHPEHDLQSLQSQVLDLGSSTANVMASEGKHAKRHHNRAIGLVSILAMMLSATSLVRAFAPPERPRVSDAADEAAGSIQQILDAQNPPSPGVNLGVSRVTSLAPSQPEPDAR